MQSPTIINFFELSRNVTVRVRYGRVMNSRPLSIPTNDGSSYFRFSPRTDEQIVAKLLLHIFEFSSTERIALETRFGARMRKRI